MIEPLELRIAPANVAITSLPDGGYEVSGSSDADSLEILTLEPGFIRITNGAGTLTLDGGDPASVVTLKTPRGPLAIDLGDGEDFLAFLDVKLRRDLTIDCGNGNDLLILIGLAVTGNLVANMGEGDDDVSAQRTNTIGKDFELNLGAGADDRFSNITASESLVVRGDFRLTSTADEVHFHAGGRPLGSETGTGGFVPLARFHVLGTATFELGGIGTQHLAMAAADLRFGSLAVFSLNVASDLQFFLAANSFRAPGGVRMESLGDANVVWFGENISVGRSLVAENLGGSHSFRIETTNLLKLPAVALELGDGMGVTSLDSNRKINIRGVEISSSVGQDFFAIKGSGKVAGPLSLEPGAGLFTLVFVGNALGALTLAKPLSLDTGEALDITATLVNFNGGLTTTGSASTGSEIDFDSVISKGPLELNLGSGADVVRIDSEPDGLVRPSVFKRTVLIETGGGGDVIELGGAQPGSIGAPGHITFQQRVDINGWTMAGTFTTGPAEEVTFKRGLFVDGIEETV